MRDLFLARRQRDLAKEKLELFDGHAGKLIDIPPTKSYGQRFRLQPRAFAGRANRRRHVLLDLFLNVVARRFTIAPLQVVDDALERGAVLPRLAAARRVGKVLLAIGSIEDDVEHFVGKLLDRRRRLHAIGAQHAFELLHVIRIHRRIPSAAQVAAPRHDRALGDGLAAIGNHFPRIDLDLLAETAARRARSVGGVKGKEPRRKLLEREPAIDAGEGFAEREFFITDERRHDAAGKAQRRLDRIGEPLANVGLHHETVDDHFDRVLALLVENDFR